MKQKQAPQAPERHNFGARRTRNFIYFMRFSENLSLPKTHNEKFNDSVTYELSCTWQSESASETLCLHNDPRN